jgi:hypothetical protein
MAKRRVGDEAEDEHKSTVEHSWGMKKEKEGRERTFGRYLTRSSDCKRVNNIDNTLSEWSCTVTGLCDEHCFCTALVYKYKKWEFRIVETLCSRLCDTPWTRECGSVRSNDRVQEFTKKSVEYIFKAKRASWETSRECEPRAQTMERRIFWETPVEGNESKDFLRGFPNFSFKIRKSEPLRRAEGSILSDRGDERWQRRYTETQRHRERESERQRQRRERDEDILWDVLRGKDSKKDGGVLTQHRIDTVGVWRVQSRCCSPSSALRVAMRGWAKPIWVCPILECLESNRIVRDDHRVQDA